MGCRARAGKAALVRVVSSGSGPVLDREGSAPGRGAYVHPDPSCLRAAGRPGALARALRTGVRPEEVGRLMLEIER
ncbi:MAG TPA: YlxR family protein, partial [Actinomycetota bacterium]|nr:YlxR family protein [Actinomycetota bacterium]